MFCAPDELQRPVGRKQLVEYGEQHAFVGLSPKSYDSKFVRCTAQVPHYSMPAKLGAGRLLVGCAARTAGRRAGYSTRPHSVARAIS